MVESNNPEAFADKLIYLSENPDIIKQMGFNAIKLAQKKFDMKILEKKFVKCFDEVKLEIKN